MRHASARYGFRGATQFVWKRSRFVCIRSGLAIIYIAVECNGIFGGAGHIRHIWWRRQGAVSDNVQQRDTSSGLRLCDIRHTICTNPKRSCYATKRHDFGNGSSWQDSHLHRDHSTEPHQ